MARSSFGPRRATTWTVTQQPRPMSRVVRLGRAANDNSRRPRFLTRAVVLALGGVVLALVLANWRFV